VDNLIAENVQAIEDYRDDFLGIHSPQCPISRIRASLKSLTPVLFRNDLVLKIPEWLKDVTVFDQ
jgi:hypothetical protein